LLRLWTSYEAHEMQAATVAISFLRCGIGGFQPRCFPGTSMIKSR
jgi:hypothetical protein